MPFEAGKSGNPSGRPRAGTQAFADRLAYWLETKTIDEIKAIVRNTKEWGKLPAIDGIVVRRINAALMKAGSNADFTAVLDRFVGRPVQPVAGEFKVTHGLADRLKRAMQIVDEPDEPITLDSQEVEQLISNEVISQGIKVASESE